MPTKQSLIDNIQEYEPLQIAIYIRDGLVTFDELSEEPDFAASARKAVISHLSTFEDEDWDKAKKTNTVEAYERYLANYREGRYRQEARTARDKVGQLQPDTPMEDTDTVWLNLDKTDVNALRSFVKNYPESSHIEEAKSKIFDLSRQRYRKDPFEALKDQIKELYRPDVIVKIIKEAVDNGSISVQQIYDEIARNHNWLSSFIIADLAEKKVINFFDLEEAGIRTDFIEYVINNDLQKVSVDVCIPKLESLPPMATEVYFWGIPASGKTCALGAIMNEARHGGFVEFAEPNTACKGFHYMNELSELFTDANGVIKLPPATETEAIFDMGFIFKKDKYEYPVTLIDLPGETIESMYNVNAKIPLDEEHARALDIACKLLNGNLGVNRKIHFFVLEYKGHASKYKGITQDCLITSAMTFIKETGIFKKETDAVFLLVTKSDLTGACDDEQRIQILSNYIKKYYHEFYNGLKYICDDNHINDGEVDIIPFSIGDVCFKNLCLYDRTAAKEVVEIIINRANGVKTGRWAKFLKQLKK